MVGNRETMIRRLAAVNYYRLSGYWFPFRNADSSFKDDTRFDMVWNRYLFDHRLRLLMMDAIGDIEIAVRTRLAYHHAHHFGPFAFAEEPESLPGLKNREAFLRRVIDEVERSRETFIDHFNTKYGESHQVPPVWMTTEVMSFGSVLTLYRGCPRRVRNAVAEAFAVPDAVLNSWILCLNTVRNICAHHGRLWNRELGVKPKIPLQRFDPRWHEPVEIPKNRIFGVLTICAYCLNEVGRNRSWPDRARSLLEDFSGIPVKSMGFPDDWMRSPLWKGGVDAG